MKYLLLFYTFVKESHVNYFCHLLFREVIRDDFLFEPSFPLVKCVGFSDKDSTTKMDREVEKDYRMIHGSRPDPWHYPSCLLWFEIKTGVPYYWPHPLRSVYLFYSGLFSSLSYSLILLWCLCSRFVRMKTFSRLGSTLTSEQTWTSAYSVPTTTSSPVSIRGPTTCIPGDFPFCVLPFSCHYGKEWGKVGRS